MVEFNAGEFLDTPIYAFDFQSMIGDVKDFLEFSESNIEWQYRREMQAISHQNLDDCPPLYREHLEQNAEARFKVSLALRVRYAAVISLTTSVEWSVKVLNEKSRDPAKGKKPGNETVKILRDLCTRSSMSATGVIDDYEAIVNVRNCIVHSAGLLESYSHKEKLPKDVERLVGFSLENWQFLGDQVCIRQGAIESYIDQLAALVVDLHRRMIE